MRQLLTVFALLLISSAPVWAAEQQPEISPEEIEKMEAEAEESKKEAGKLSLALSEEMRAISEELSQVNKRHFFMIYNNHNIIATVQTVKTDVSNAVATCAEKHESLKTPITERYNIWQDAVDTKLEEAQGFINNMMIAQDYIAKSKIETILKKADELRAATAARVKKVPVTTAEACEFLLNKMDDTQETMVTLIDQTLISGANQLNMISEEEARKAEEQKSEDSETTE